MHKVKSRICAYCFEMFPASVFPKDKNSADGKAHYCKRCVREIASDNIYRVGHCLICGEEKQVNRRVCPGCKKIVIMVNVHYQFWDRRMYYTKLMWLSQRIEAIECDYDDEMTVIAKRVRGQNFRAVLNQYEGLLDKNAVQYLWMIQNGLCAYTGKPITLETAHLEHMTPLARFGHNTIDNVVFIHEKVNLAKHDKNLLEFCGSYGLFPTTVSERILKIQNELYVAKYLKKQPQIRVAA